MSKRKNGDTRSKKPSDAMRKWISLMTNEVLRRYLYLHEWHISICYCLEQPTREDLADEDNIYAHISTDDVYLRATLHIPPVMVVDWNKKRRTKRFFFGVLIHEMSHIVTDPLYLYASDKFKAGSPEAREFRAIRERQTQRIANLAIAGIPGKKYE